MKRRILWYAQRMRTFKISRLAKAYPSLSKFCLANAFDKVNLAPGSFFAK